MKYTLAVAALLSLISKNDVQAINQKSSIDMAAHTQTGVYAE